MHQDALLVAARLQMRALKGTSTGVHMFCFRSYWKTTQLLLEVMSHYCMLYTHGYGSSEYDA